MLLSGLPLVLGLVISSAALHIPFQQSKRAALVKRGGIKFTASHGQKAELFAFNSKAAGDGLDLQYVLCPFQTMANNLIVYILAR
jgi:uncharacterized caspase-like protein